MKLIYNSKSKALKTAAIAAGVLVLGGVGYLIYTKYFKRAAEVAAPILEAAVEAVEM